MTRHEVTTLRAITRLREDNSARPTRTSEQALVSAPELDKCSWDSFTILCDSRNHASNTIIPHQTQIHCESTAIHLEHHGNSKETGVPTRSAHQTFRIKSHGSSSHCAFHIHVLPVAEQF